jgi:thioredoxin-dependent peroxiredoxin
MRAKLGAILAAVLVGAGGVAVADPGPAVGQQAKEFDLEELGGGRAKLSELSKAGPVVLVVLRGYPGYQCPVCSRQFGEFLGRADDFKAAGATVAFVYPGPAAGLKGTATEFVKGRDYPAHFRLLLDPDYAFTTAYGLRWDAKNETAYPSTFVVGAGRKVTFARVSTTHGGRLSAADALKALAVK